MAHSAANAGLESLAAEASRRAESLELEQAGPSTDANGSKSVSQGSGQKGKVRKAYTITKQRERWTDSEHDRFLQALKRYGRAWRKIEEHIGTKTAVQIRSHAQKFFSKLQREQSTGGQGDESSKAEISIPPPRPKRKPMHPYPRKTNGDSTTDNTSTQQTSQQPAALQPAPSAPSSTPSNISVPAMTGLDNRFRNASLGQVLEAAAVAAASAWTHVVAQAGCKVQQQLQAHGSTQQGLQNMQPMLNMNSALLYQMAMQQQMPAQQPVAANLQSSSQHFTARSPFVNTAMNDFNARSASAVLNSQAKGQSAQDSPDGAGNTADQGNERDSACSKEHSRSNLADLEHALSTGRQGGLRTWKPTASVAQPAEGQLSRAAWEELMAQVQAANAASSQWADSLRLTTLGRIPSRAFSAGPILNDTAAMQQDKHNPLQLHTQNAIEKQSGPDVAAGRSQSQSGTSQLAHYFQQAAAEELKAAQEAENAENGSSGEGGGSSGDGAGSNGKVGLPRSDKGSNIGASNSDEDGNGNGSRSDLCVPDTRDGAANEGKGSDEGSNSPRGFARNYSPSATDSAKPRQLDSPPQAAQTLFSLGRHANTGQRAAPTAQLQDQPTASPNAATHPLPAAANKQSQAQASALPQELLTALQQQAMSTLANAAPQTPQAGLQLLHGLFSSMQPASKEGQQAIATLTPQLIQAGDTSMSDRRSSGMPSMDTFHSFSSRSCSVPPGMATGSEVGAGIHTEEASGFKPYTKRAGVPLTSLPPAKRFAAASREQFVKASLAKDATLTKPGIAPPSKPDSVGS